MLVARHSRRLAGYRAALAAALLCCLPGLALAQNVTPFSPAGPTVTLSATNANSRVQVQTALNSRSMRIYNSGTVAVFIACGDNTVVAATTTGMPVAPGTVEVVTCPTQYVAGITASGTASVYVTPGTGL